MPLDTKPSGTQGPFEYRRLDVFALVQPQPACDVAIDIEEIIEQISSH
jgi:hypothetical protein